MPEYLITPYGMLGSDSFTVRAGSKSDAIRVARACIAHEDWASPMGWTIYEDLGEFSDTE